MELEHELELSVLTPAEADAAMAVVKESFEAAWPPITPSRAGICLPGS